MTNSTTKNCQEFNMYMRHFLETATPEQLAAYESAREEVATWNINEVVSVKDWIIVNHDTFQEQYLGDFTIDNK